MGMAAILVMWPGPFEQTFVPPSQGDSIWNLASISPVVSEEKMLSVEDGQTDDVQQRPTYPIEKCWSDCADTRLICAFVEQIWYKQVLSWLGSSNEMFSIF